MTNLLIGLGMLFTLGITTPIVEPQVMYANEIESTEVVETPFEQVTYKGYLGKDQETSEYEFEVVLTSETDCFMKIIEWRDRPTNDSRIVTKQATYVLENLILKVNIGEPNFEQFVFQVLDGNIINCLDVVDITPETPTEPEPQEPEWHHRVFYMDKGNGLNYVLELNSPTEFRLCDYIEVSTFNYMLGTYQMRGKTIELYSEDELPFYQVDYDLETMTFKVHESIIEEIPTILDEVWSKVAYWLNQPFIIAGECSLSLGAIIWMIIRMTSFGKKNIHSLNDRMTRKEKDYESREKDYQKTIAKQNELIETYGNYILIMAENSRNEEVKKIAYEIKKDKGEVENGKEVKEETESRSN